MASGNSNVAICIDNILKTFKSEVPYARNKGIGHETLDLPAGEIEQQLNEDADNAIEEYEPRVDVDDVEIDTYDVNGNYKYKVTVMETSEE